MRFLNQLAFTLLLGVLLLLPPSFCVNAQSVVVFNQDSVIGKLSNDFYGIQYHSNTYNQSKALQQLGYLHINPVRIWAKLNEFHPEPGLWQWAEVDQKVDEVVAAGYSPVLCLYQSEHWFTGSSENPWWNDSTARAEWQEAAYRLALRYQNRVQRFIIFDEINMMHPEDGYYITFQNSARLYCAAAEKIKQVNPALQCGGPSSFGGWENAHWAEYVLNEPRGAELLDFISCNLFLSWDAEDADSLIMNRTIWYEEAPLSIKAKLKERMPPLLILDAYNVSALWQKDGQLWTDPRNTNFFGGIYQALALLHAAKGGFNVTLHWETIGGYGIFDWYPQFNPLPSYYAWRFMIEIAGLQAGSELIACHTNQTAETDIQHLGGMQVASFAVQAFAIKQADSVLSVVLINKFSKEHSAIQIFSPKDKPYFRLYRFEAQNMESCFQALQEGTASDTFSIRVPPLSITVVKFYNTSFVPIAPTASLEPSDLTIVSLYPNPFNAAVRITFKNTRKAAVCLEIFNSAGKRVAVPLQTVLAAGMHHIVWNAQTRDGRPLASGLYFCRITGLNKTDVRKLIYLR